MILATIYCIAHPSRPLDAYVGQTIKANNRFLDHRKASVVEDTHLYRWWRKRVRETGVEPTMHVLFSRLFWTRAEAKAWMDTIEIAAIAWLREHPQARCLNSTAGGDGMADPPPEVRAKMSRSMRGKTRSTEHAEKIAVQNRGRVHGLRHRILGSAASRERWADPVFKARMSALRRAAAPSHCPQGHLFDEQNTSTNAIGWRGCRACNRAKAAAIRARKRAAST